jgi:hypothetical protein
LVAAEFSANFRSEAIELHGYDFDDVNEVRGHAARLVADGSDYLFCHGIAV